MPKTLGIWLRGVLLLGVTVFLGSAHSSTTEIPEISRGAAWLQAQIAPGGTLITPAFSQGTDEQAEAETVIALAALGRTSLIPLSILNRLSSISPETKNTESLARLILALKAVSRDASQFASVLSAKQNSDGGWGVDAGLKSSQIDTLWSYYALSALPAQNASSATAWLLAMQDPDGGMLGSHLGQRIQDTALAIAAMQHAASDLRIQSAALRMGTWLGRATQADGSWGNSIYLTSIGLYALTLQALNPGAQALARQWLLARQSSDGSWEEDPFLTAVALRALAAVPPEHAQGGSITAQVVNVPGGAAIGGVQVELSGASSLTKITDANGRFVFTDLPAGSYVVRIGSAPYTPVQRTVDIALGQAVDLGAIALALSGGPAQDLGTIKGQITALASGDPIARAEITLSGAATVVVQADEQGRYQFEGISPGALTVQAAAAGYHAVTASATIAGGMTLNFSPTLVGLTDPATQPTQSRLVGVVVSNQGGALEDVTIRGNGTDIGRTNSMGMFDIAVTPGTLHLEMASPGYVSATADIVIPAASVMQLGTVVLQAVRTTSEISGVITSDSTGAPLVGAEVALQGGVTATTDSLGAYRLEGLTGNAFDLRVSALGYLSQSWRLETDTPTVIHKDFALAPMGSDLISLAAMSVSKPTLGANESLSVTTKVKNHGTDARDIVVQMLLVDSSGNVVDLVPARGVHPAELLGAFSLGAGQEQVVQFTWNSGQFAAGAYSLVARVVQAGSMTQATPSGQVLVLRTADMTVTAGAQFSGSVIANPPILRANAGTAVKLQAFIQSTGNAAVPAQLYTLAIADEATQEQLATLQTSGPVLSPSATATLDFPDWLPTRVGSFLLTVTASTDASQGRISGKLYAGDTATGNYTVNRDRVPTGTQSVRASIKIVGEDAATGGLANPIAATITKAIEKSVAYGDLQAYNWTLSNQCLGCHVQSQALVGGELSRGLTKQTDTQRNALYNALAIYRQSNGALRDDNYPGYVKAQNLLALWALNAWHKKGEIGDTLAASAGYTRGVQDVDGGWSTDYSGGWWTARAAQTAFNVKNLVDVADLQQATPAPTKYQPQIFAENAGLSGAYYLHAQGQRLLVSNFDSGTIEQWDASGVRRTLATGLNKPEGMSKGPNGSVYVATASGIYELNDLGPSPQRVGTIAAANGLVSLPDGSMFASHYGSSTIYRIDVNGSVTPYWSGAPLNGPVGLAIDEDGRLLVVNYTGRKIVRFNADKTYDTPVSLLYGYPRSLVRRGSDWIVGTSNGAYRFNAQWQGERMSFEAAHGVAVGDDGTIYTSNGAQRVSKLNPQTWNIASEIVANDTAALRGVQWLMSGTNGINTTSNLELAHQLIGLGSAYSRYSQQPMASGIFDKMIAVAALLKSRQRADGGWGLYSSSSSDSMVTAQVGYALDYVNPSSSDPHMLRAVQYLLSRQQADGSWISENGIFSTRYGATSWVEIWLPVALERVGGIDTQLNLRFAPNVRMSNPTLNPTQTAVQADGSTDYTWELLGVTTRKRQIDFDLTLSDMLPGEERPISTHAQMRFRNSFISDTVTSNVDIPIVRASAGIDIAVRTDRTNYAANTAVAISAKVVNTSSGEQVGSVALAILAPDGLLVADLGSSPFQGLAPMAEAVVPSSWNTGTVLAGRYSVQARLFDTEGHLVGTATAFFDVGLDPSGGSGIAAQVRTDKVRYQVGATVQITSRAVNTAANQVWSDLFAKTEVYTPAGGLLWSTTTTIASLAPSGRSDFSYSLPLGSAAAGSYTVRLSVLDRLGKLLASDQTTFAVQSSATMPISGAGLRGTLSPASAIVPMGQAVPVVFAVTNMGNANLVGGTVRVRLLRPDGISVLETFTRTDVNLLVGQTQQFQWAWSAHGAQGDVFPLSASFALAGGEQTLAQGSVTLKGHAAPQPIPLSWPWLLSLLLPIQLWMQRRRPHAPSTLAQ